MRFHTDFKYTSRKDKPEYVWRKYKEILQGGILDVGGDECGLKKFLPEGTEYIGIGLGGSVDVEIDIEKERLPYEDNRFLKESGRMNSMVILQMDRENADLHLKRRLYRMVLKLVMHKDVDVNSLLSGSVWAVLVKKSFNLQEGGIIIEE